MILNYLAMDNHSTTKKTITDINGNNYVYDPTDESITINGVQASDQEYEPVYINSTLTDMTPPIFSGIWFKRLGKILGLNGRINNLKQNK